MSVDDVAQYCKFAGQIYSTPEQESSFENARKILVNLDPHAPSQLRPDVELLIADYRALAKQDRVLVQVKDEVDNSYQRIQQFRKQICT